MAIASQNKREMDGAKRRPSLFCFMKAQGAVICICKTAKKDFSQTLNFANADDKSTLVDCQT